MTAVDFDKLFSAFAGLKVAVIGDVMLDTYWWGKVERISPEAPVPVVAVTKKDYRLGGAANVALNIKALQADVAMFSVIGQDDDAKLLKKRFDEEGIGTSHLLESAKRITTNKSRIISRNQQMMRLDAEITEDLDDEDETRLIEAIRGYFEKEKPQVVIFEDYNKGVLTERVITTVINLCHQYNIITTVDPKRKNFFTYRGVSIFKPNLKEVKDALNLLSDDLDLPALLLIHQRLSEKLLHKISLITLSEKGVFYNQTAASGIVPSHVRNVSDVSGAGDTVIAVASLVYAITSDTLLMAETANIAGGLVCEQVGTVAINKERLLEECKLLLCDE
ncbi:MAG: PfkB family carbohydrate kinase [Chitinophagaceae bacterium]